MTRIKLTLLLCSIIVCKLHTQTRVYLFSGLGSDARIFEKINLDSNYKITHILYPTPSKKATMKEYAQTLISQIDTSTPVILIGVSIGGMICAELSELIQVKKVILISSAKCRQELPFRYRFQKTIPLNKITPKGLIKFGAQLLQPLVEPDRNKNKVTFKSMLNKKNKRYLKRSINMIINWDKAYCNKSMYHIHGTKDHTLPIKKIQATHTIKGGSHMMTLTRGDEINTLLLAILQQSL